MLNLSDKTTNSKPQRWLIPVVYKKKHKIALCSVEKSLNARAGGAGRLLRMDGDLAWLEAIKEAGRPGPRT